MERTILQNILTYELGDFVPAITDICKEVKILPMVSFGEQAIMTIVDLEKPEDTIVFTSPMSTASLKGLPRGAEPWSS